MNTIVPHSWRLSALLLLTLAATGCVMPDQVSRMQKDLADVRQQLRQVQSDQSQSLRKLEELESRVSSSDDRVTRADFADLDVRIAQLSSDVAISDERMNELGRRLDRLSRQVQSARESSRVGGGTSSEPSPATPGGDSVPRTGVAPGALPDPESLYNTAYADFSKGNYALAISGFEEYHEKFPATSLADNALYWVGECHFSQGDFDEAIAAFDRLLERFEGSDKAAAANLKKGLAYLETNEVGRAIVQLRFVVSEYPGSDEAKIARDKLTSLGAST